MTLSCDTKTIRGDNYYVHNVPSNTIKSRGVRYLRHFMTYLAHIHVQLNLQIKHPWSAITFAIATKRFTFLYWNVEIFKFIVKIILENYLS